MIDKIGIALIKKIIGLFSDYVGIPYSSDTETSMMSYLRTGSSRSVRIKFYGHVYGTSLT